jgi:hypothetical protein
MPAIAVERTWWWMWLVLMCGLGALVIWYERGKNEFGRRKMAQSEVFALQGELHRMWRTGLPTPNTVGEVLDHARASDSRDSQYCARMTGLDPWGNEYRIKSVPDRERYGIDGARHVTVWSFGPNEKDDHGAGDDVRHSTPWFPPRDYSRGQPDEP